MNEWSWHGIVGVVTKLGAGRCGVRIPVWEDIFLYSKNSRPPREGHSASYRVRIEIKQPGREVDHSPVSRADVKN